MSSRKERKAAKAAKISGKGGGDSGDAAVLVRVGQAMLVGFLAFVTFYGVAAFKQGTALPIIFERRAPAPPKPSTCWPGCCFMLTRSAACEANSISNLACRHRANKQL